MVANAEGSRLNWTEKHRPSTLSDVQGHNTHLKEIERWATDWTPGDAPILLIGPPGIGKTATAQALANDMDWDMTEINASSDRRASDIAAIARNISAQSIDQDSQELLFLDEVDAFASQTSLNPLIDLLADPPAPIILAANKEWKVPSAITRHATQYDFSLGKASIKARLRQLCEDEDIGISSMDIGKLATRGNLRAAINDLQHYAETNELDWDQRQTEIDNFEAVDNVLRGKRYTGDMTPDALVIWLDENLAAEFRGLEAAVAYDALSRADKWLGRCTNNDYHWWRYAGRLADQTASLRLTEAYDGYLSKSYPSHYRHSTPSPTDNTNEAALYRALKGYSTGEFSFSGNYQEFRQQILPRLLSYDTDVRLQLAIGHGLQPDTDGPALRALNLSDDDVASVMETAEPEPTPLGEW